MVVSDVNIFCEGQRKALRLKVPNTQVDCIITGKIPQISFYKDRYCVLNKKRGIWYKFYPNARDDGNYSKEFLDLYPECSKHRIVFLDSLFKQNILEIMQKIHLDSTVKSLYFFADLQGYNEDIQSLEFDEFCNLFIDEHIYFNTIYHIQGNNSVI